MFNPLKEMLEKYYEDEANRDQEGQLVLDADESEYLIKTFIEPTIEGYSRMLAMRKDPGISDNTKLDAIALFNRLTAMILKTAVDEFNRGLS